MIFFLYGPDDYRAKQKINVIKRKFVADVDPTASSLSWLTGFKWTIADWHDLTASNSLFARRRLVIVEDVCSRKEKGFLESFIENINTSDSGENIWIFYEPRIVNDKKGEKQYLNSEGREQKLTITQKKLINLLSADQQQYFGLLGKEVIRWVVDQAREQGVGISQEAAQSLIAILGGDDLWLLSGEIAKLAAYNLAQGKEMISADDVRLLSSGETDQNIFSLIDAISQRNKKLAVRIFDEQYRAGLSDVYLVAMLLRQIRIMLILRQSLEVGQTPQAAAGFLKLHPYALQKSLGQAKNFKLEELQKLFTWLINIDKDLKTGKADLAVSLTEWIAVL